MNSEGVESVGTSTPGKMRENNDVCGLPVYMIPIGETNPLAEDPRNSMFTPWTSQIPALPPVTPHTPLVPNSLARPPHTWSKDEVRVWLDWCAKEWAIEPVLQDKFDMNGKALGLLTKADFLERDPSGDLLFNALQRLVNKHEVSTPCSYPSHAHIGPPPGVATSYPHHSPPYLPIKPTPVHETRQNGIILFTGNSPSATAQPSFISEKSHPSYVPIRPVPVTSYPSPIQHKDLSPKIPESMLSPAPTTDTDSGAETELLAEGEEDMAYTEEDIHSPENRMSRDVTDHTLPPVKKSEGDCRLLWEFIHQLLQESRYRDFVSWDRQEELIFRIVNPTGLAELWGYQKNRTNMTYEKLSRALRYYYKMNIIKKVSGKRLTYQFLQHPRNIKKGQRGARPHSARFVKDSNNRTNEPITTDTQKEASNSPIRDLQTEDRKPIIHHESLPIHAHQPIRSPHLDPFDKECDLQLINGHLQPLPMDDDLDPEVHPMTFVKQEVPVQDEPEDLSMKSVKRCSSIVHSDSMDKQINVVDIKTELSR